MSVFQGAVQSPYDHLGMCACLDMVTLMLMDYIAYLIYIPQSLSLKAFGV